MVADRTHHHELPASRERVCPRLRKVDLLGIPIDDLRRDEFAEAMEELVRRPGMAVMAPINVDTMNKTQTDRRLREFLLRADLVYADGAGIVLGAWLQGKLLPGRLTAADLIEDVCERWSDGRHSFYFLGGLPGVAEKAAEVLRSRYPGVRIVGTHRGHLDTEAEERAALADVANKRPDVLCVGFGTPLQERFIERYSVELRNVPVVWPVGAMTTYIAGVVPRAPVLMQETGLEWLFRLSLEPKRMWRRYVIGNPAFVARVVADRVRPNGSNGA